MPMSRPAPRPAQNGPPHANAPSGYVKARLWWKCVAAATMTTPRLTSDTIHSTVPIAPIDSIRSQGANSAAPPDPPRECKQHDADDRQRDRVDLEPRHPRSEVAEVLHEPDDAGGHDQRDRGHRGADEEERDGPSAAVLERLAQVEIGPARARHRRAELGPDEPVGQREQRAEDPPEARLRPAERGDHERDRHERPDPAHLRHVERDRRAQAEAPLEALVTPRAGFRALLAREALLTDLRHLDLLHRGPGGPH